MKKFLASLILIFLLLSHPQSKELNVGSGEIIILLLVYSKVILNLMKPIMTKKKKL